MVLLCVLSLSLVVWEGAFYDVVQFGVKVETWLTSLALSKAEDLFLDLVGWRRSFGP